MTNEILKEGQFDCDVFSFEDYQDAYSLFDFIGCFDNGKWYDPPVNLYDVERLLTKGLHHASALLAKLNILKVTFKPTEFLSRSEFEKLAFNYLVLGNGYLEMQRNRFGKVVGMKSRLALYMRRASNLKDFVYLRNNFVQLNYEEINGNDVIHIMQPNLKQEIYGVPYYLAAMDSIDLNSAATKFRVRYYKNGSHAGFILYSTDTQIDEKGWDAVKSQLRESKGAGNFKNVVLRAPGGNPDGIKLIPIAEVAAKDEFLNIKAPMITALYEAASSFVRVVFPKRLFLSRFLLTSSRLPRLALSCSKAANRSAAAHGRRYRQRFLFFRLI